MKTDKRKVTGVSHCIDLPPIREMKLKIVLSQENGRQGRGSMDIFMGVMRLRIGEHLHNPCRTKIRLLRKSKAIDSF